MTSTTLQDDEMDALRAIYDEDFRKAEGAESSYAVYVHSDDSTLSAELNVSLPADYPKQAPPIYELKNADSWLSMEERQYVARNFETIYSEGNGEVVVYQWVEWLRDFIKGKQDDRRTGGVASEDSPTKDQLASSKEPTHLAWTPSRGEMLPVNSSHGVERDGIASSEATSSERGAILDIVHGEPLTDRKSTFQAHVACVNSNEEVKMMLTQLKSNRKIATATHNILAYRIHINSQGVYQQDCDDDGESGAGGRLLHLLQIMNVQNAAVVVTRWFGGILLHADRFKHINNVARIVIQESVVGLQHLDKKLQEKSVTSKKKRTKLKPRT